MLYSCFASTLSRFNEGIMSHQKNLYAYSNKSIQREACELTTFIDLFAGLGGFRIALESFGLKCIFSSEWDESAQNTYNMNYGEIPEGDITKIDENFIPDHDVLCAGFPCQAFSISGKQKGFQDTRGTLFFDVARIVAKKKPKVLFLENVKNLLKHDNGRTISTILKILDEIGYDVQYKILSASDFGIPTKRDRVYLVGFRRDLNIKNFQFPEPIGKKVFLKDYIDDVTDPRYIIDRDDIKIDKTPKEPANKPIRIGTINSGGQGERIYSIEGHSITFSAYGGGAASKTGAYLVGDIIRKLTPRECYNIMGFPEDFIIATKDSQAYKQIGNSVPIPVLKKIFEKINEACRNE